MVTGVFTEKPPLTITQKFATGVAIFAIGPSLSKTKQTVSTRCYLSMMSDVLRPKRGEGADRRLSTSGGDKAMLW